MSEVRIQARLADQLGEWLTDRQDLMGGRSPSIQAQTELEAWSAALRAELARIRLDLDEVAAIADVMADVEVTGQVGGRVVFTRCADAFHERPGHSPADRHGVDAASLLEYLRGLGPTADHALHAAIVTWARANRPADQAAAPADQVATWAAVGLTITAPSTAAT